MPAEVDATVVTRILENGGHIAGKAVCEVCPKSSTRSLGELRAQGTI